MSQELRQPNLVTCMLYNSPEVRRYSIDQGSSWRRVINLGYRFQVLTPDGSLRTTPKNVFVTAGIEKNGYFKQEVLRHWMSLAGLMLDYTDLFENNGCCVRLRHCQRAAY
ncbi:hypothetical protein OK016_25540 [Vibrio chagasii]|nr:hypothetical protein [Vibrio chagasii]